MQTLVVIRMLLESPVRQLAVGVVRHQLLQALYLAILMPSRPLISKVMRSHISTRVNLHSNMEGSSHSSHTVGSNHNREGSGTGIKVKLIINSNLLNRRHLLQEGLEVTGKGFKCRF